MLTKPVYGWSDFHLDGTSTYGLSYLDDIAFEWLEQAIHGLETMRPFCVKGFLEPNRFLCVVSYWNCHIIREGDERGPLDKKDVASEMSHTNMLQFCRYLHDDISQFMDEWVSFIDYGDMDEERRKKRRKIMAKKLNELEKLISQKEEWFDDHHAFL